MLGKFLRRLGKLHKLLLIEERMTNVESRMSHIAHLRRRKGGLRLDGRCRLRGAAGVPGPRGASAVPHLALRRIEARRGTLPFLLPRPVRAALRRAALRQRLWAPPGPARRDRVVAIFSGNLAAGRVSTIYGTGEQTRD